MDTGCIPPTVNFFQYTSPLSLFSAVFAKFLGTMDAIYPISSQISIKKYVLITAFRVTLGH